LNLSKTANRELVYGRTLNPFNRKLTSGGSSGGEGALVAFRGSPIGLAADIGGSIRSPAANNGLFGAKISSARVPLDGIFTPVHGNDAVPCVVGPVCRSARDNEYFFKAILGTEPWKLTHSVVPLPWKEISLPEKLKIAFLWDDGIVKPHPPITTAMQNLKRKLDHLPQFETVNWQPFEHARGYDVVRRLYYTDGARGHKEVMESVGEPLLPLTAWVMKESHTKELSIPELYDLVKKREAYRGRCMIWTIFPA
jgi:amidase